MAINGAQPDLRDFILRRLEDEDREKIEEALFADDSLFESLVEEENDLIDDWARGDLDPEEGRLVEKTIGATPRGAGRLRFAQRFVAAAAAADLAPVTGFRRRSAAWVPVAAAAGLAVVVAGLWITQNRSDQGVDGRPAGRQATHRPLQRPAPAPAPPISETPSRTIAGNPAPAPSIADSAAPAAAARLALSLAVVRGEEREAAIEIAPSQPLEVSILLDPLDRYETYAVTVRGPDGSVIHSSPAVQPVSTADTPTVQVGIPADQLSEGPHEVAVSADGIDLGWVTFRVRR